jgi:enoyl-[acyl-carrier protein] reductase I
MSTGRLFEGKRVLVFGVANDRSIAWGIAQAMSEQGARFAFTFAGEAFEKRVRPLSETVDTDLVMQCDVTNDAEVDEVFRQVEEKWGGLDVLVHSVAYANKEDLEGNFRDTSRDGFLKAMEVSAYSLVSLSRRAAPLLAKSGGNIITLSYYGSVKVITNYNVMGVAKAALEACVRYLAADLGPEGIRVNAISAGPIKTLAASGVRNFKGLMSGSEAKVPLRRNATAEDVGKSAVFLCSDLGRGVTGEVIFVDSGYHIMGV